jgi:hypothetical protein
MWHATMPRRESILSESSPDFSLDELDFLCANDLHFNERITLDYVSGVLQNLSPARLFGHEQFMMP